MVTCYLFETDSPETSGIFRISFVYLLARWEVELHTAAARFAAVVGVTITVGSIRGQNQWTERNK